MISVYDLIGIGLGPANLSLAALLEGCEDKHFHFFDQNSHFQWHPELLFEDAYMQTSFLKDLVTFADPTSRYTFINYLHQQGLLSAFLNKQSPKLSRLEYQLYCQWVSHQLQHRLSYNHKVSKISHEGDFFKVEFFDAPTRFAKNLCIGTGPKPYVPIFARHHLGTNVFHAKSSILPQLNVTNKRVVIIGGGQTGVEVFRNILKENFGKPLSLQLFTKRENLVPLNDSPFADEYYTPNYVNQFITIDAKLKPAILEKQLMTSDGNTGWYLQELYRDLYHLKYLYNDPRSIEICPLRDVFEMQAIENSYRLSAHNHFNNSREEFDADIVILCTGFRSELPDCLKTLQKTIQFDQNERPGINDDFSLKTSISGNKIFMVNFSRHHHGIADPQTSLMAWRSGVIINSLLGRDRYQCQDRASFVRWHSNGNDLSINLSEANHV